MKYININKRWRQYPCSYHGENNGAPDYECEHCGIELIPKEERDKDER
jgi:hypothetical protein